MVTVKEIPFYSILFFLLNPTRQPCKPPNTRHFTKVLQEDKRCEQIFSFLLLSLNALGKPHLFLIQNLPVNKADTGRPRRLSLFSSAVCCNEAPGWPRSRLSTSRISEPSLSALRLARRSSRVACFRGFGAERRSPGGPPLISEDCLPATV